MNIKNPFRKKEEKSLTDRALEHYSKHKPVSNKAKGMFADETAETYRQRFARARMSVKV